MDLSDIFEVFFDYLRPECQNDIKAISIWFLAAVDRFRKIRKTYCKKVSIGFTVK